MEAVVRVLSASAASCVRPAICLFFLARCGFDAFDLDTAENLQAALDCFGTFTVAYHHMAASVAWRRARSTDRLRHTHFSQPRMGLSDCSLVRAKKLSAS